MVGKDFFCFELTECTDFFTRRKQRILPAVLRSGCLRFSTLGRKPRTRDLQQSLQRLWVRSPCSCLMCTLSLSLSLSISPSHTHTHTHSHNGVHVCKYNLLYNRTISWWVLETGKNSYSRIPGKVMLYYIYLVCTMSVVGLKTSCCLLAIRVYTSISIGRWELLVRVEMFITCFIQTTCLYELWNTILYFSMSPQEV